MLRMSLAQSPIPGTTIILERIRKRGYVSLLEMFAPSRISRETAVYETHLVYPEFVEGYLVFQQAQQDCERRCTEFLSKCSPLGKSAWRQPTRLAPVFFQFYLLILVLWIQTVRSNRFSLLNQFQVILY